MAVFDRKAMLALRFELVLELRVMVRVRVNHVTCGHIVRDLDIILQAVLSVMEG